MSLFSQRRGLKPIRSVLQVDTMDSDLRNGLWNALSTSFFPPPPGTLSFLSEKPALKNLCQKLWVDYFKAPIDTLDSTWNRTHLRIRTYFYDCEWYEVYDIVEFVASNYEHYRTSSLFIANCNSVLEREKSAFRFVGGRITEITSKEEIAEIEEVLESSFLRPVTNHLGRALELLTDRKSPDYRNSIKESVSAVEAICNLVGGSSSATLGQALKELDKGSAVDMHPALRGAFDKLYGYTSDADGIRHALLTESNLQFEDAKFMLVSCSAFVNYVKAKSAKAGIKF